MKKIYLFYKDKKWKSINRVDDIGSVKDIRFVLIPLLGIKDPVYIPVDATFVKEFHHGSISLVIRDTVLEYDDLKDDQYHLFSNTMKFTDVIEYVNYLHSVYRLRGFEMLRSDGYTECPGVSTMFDIATLVADAYDKKDDLITQINYKAKQSPYTLMNEEKLSINRLYKSVLKKLENVIVEIDMAPIDDNMLQLMSDGSYHHIVTSKYYGTNQFFYFPNMHLFYFEKRDSITELYQLLTKTVKFSFAMYSINETDNPELAELSLTEISERLIDGNISYYDALWFEQMYFSRLLETIVCLPIILQYLAFEAMYVIFDNGDDNKRDRFTNVVRIECQRDKGRNYELVTSTKNFKSLHRFLKELMQ